MSKNTLALTILSAALLTSLPMIANAYPGGYGPHHGTYGRGAAAQTPELTKEQVAQMDKLCEEHRAALLPLRDQLIQKRMELRALSPNPNVKPEELKALTAEITKLHEQIRTVNDDFYAKMDKAGLPCYGGSHQRGWHHHAPYAGHGCPNWR